MVSPIRFVIFILLVAGCYPALAEVTELDNTQLQKLQSEGVLIIDVRREDEWQQTGLLEGSHGLTFFDKRGRYDVEKWLAALDGLADKGDPIILICARGVRSARIAQLLDSRLGYSQMHNVTGGILRWLQQGLPVTPYKP